MMNHSWETKILSRKGAHQLRASLRKARRTVVFTNGCFDILHAGHISTLAFARSQGDMLIVGVNSDASLRALKGVRRPFVSESDRITLLAALEAVSYVVVFEEREVETLVRELKPDVLVKGRDREGDVVGQQFVESYGGKVLLAPIVEGRSTSRIINRVGEAYRASETLR